MKFTKIGLGVASIVFVAGAGVAHAQFKLPGALGSLTGSSSNSATTDVTSDSLVRSFVSANQEVLTAQKFLALAYDQKDKAALLESEAAALQNEGVGSDELKKAVELSAKTNEELATMQAEKAQLSEEQKQYYVQSLPHLVRGVAGTRQVIDQASKFGASAESSMVTGGLGGGMSKLQAAMFVVKETPSYSKAVFDMFRKTVAIGKSNKVKMPADATSALSGLEP